MSEIMKFQQEITNAFKCKGNTELKKKQKSYHANKQTRILLQEKYSRLKDLE